MSWTSRPSVKQTSAQLILDKETASSVHVYLCMHLIMNRRLEWLMERRMLSAVIIFRGGFLPILPVFYAYFVEFL